LSFQGYIDNIKAKTGKTPEEFRDLARENGILKSDMKTGELVAWLKKDFDLSHGHAMAIWKIVQGQRMGRRITNSERALKRSRRQLAPPSPSSVSPSSCRR